jgi:hypothetical protein
MHSSCQRGSHGKADGEKKGMGKKEEVIVSFVEKEKTYNIFKSRQFPLSPQNS